MTALDLRPATVGDIPAIAAIYGESVANGTGTFELEPPGEAEMGSRLATLQRSGHPWLVGVDDGAVVGFAYAGPFRLRPAYRRTVEDAIYLAPTARGRGVGRQLLGALVDEATRLGHRRMLAVIGDSANAASIALHAAMGFTRAGVYTDVGWKFGRWLDIVLMQRPLGAGSSAPLAD